MNNWMLIKGNSMRIAMNIGVSPDQTRDGGLSCVDLPLFVPGHFHVFLDVATHVTLVVAYRLNLAVKSGAISGVPSSNVHDLRNTTLESLSFVECDTILQCRKHGVIL